jgi:hypothetical protein
VAIFLESPCELLPVKLSIVAVIHSAEDTAKSSDTIGTSLLKDNKDLIKDSIGGLSGNPEDWVNIGTVATSSSCEGSSELFIVKFTVSI